MPTLECCYLVTSLPPRQPTCVLAHTLTIRPPPNSGLCQDPGRLTPPSARPFPLFPLHSHWPPQRRTIVYFHSPPRPCWSGGPAESLHYCLVLPCNPLPSRPGLTPFTVLKSTICITQQSGSEREGETGQEGERKQGGEKGDDGRGGREGRKGERKGERTRGIWMGVALSVGKYLSNSFHSVKASPLLPFLQTWCLLIFLLPPFISSFNFYFPQSSNPPRFFPLCVLPPLNFSQTILHSLFPWPASVLSILPSIPPPTRPLLGVHPSSCCRVAQAFQGLLYGCMCEEGGFFPWGRRWKLGLTLSAKGRHLSLSPHLLEGSPVTPPPLPSIHPSHPLSIHLPPLPCAAPPCWITQECAPSLPTPSLLSSLSFSLRPVTNSSLGPPSFPSHLPSHSACFRLASTHLSPLSLHL